MKYIKQVKKPTKYNFKLYRNKNAIRLHWDIITHCNFKCPYCYARAEEGNWFKISDKNLIDDTISKIKKISKPLEIILLGGEPTLHPNYFYILDRISEIENDKEFGIITNGMFKNSEEFILKHQKYKENFSFSVTFHPSQHDESSIDEFKKNIKFINDNNFHMNVNVMLDNMSNDEKIVNILSFLEEENIGFYYNVPFESHQNVVNHFDNTSEYASWINSLNSKYPGQKELKYVGEEEKTYNDIEVVLENLQNFNGWKCYNNNFEIKAGTSDFIRMCSLEKYSIEKINNIQPMVCSLNKCLCQGLLSNEKIRITK